MSQYIREAEESETAGITARDIDIIRMCAREIDVPFVLQLHGFTTTPEGEISRLPERR
jgi:collagenase-like PrtC family protease